MTCYNCKDETEKETPVFELMKYLKDSDGWYKQRCPQCLITAKEEWLKDINNDKKHILIMWISADLKIFGKMVI